ncbi:MAG: c-type cytochrome [Syntrophobacteraceae bacterium]|jgi:mono/diheme cytochrome c family protein|nr:c-type cytochrome [Syntrophobacteraceae bacterium]
MKKLLIPAILLVVVTVVYHLLMTYDNNFPYGRMRETPAVRPYEKPILVMEAGLVPVGGGEALFRAASPDALKSPLDAGDPGVVEAGKKLYLTYCQQCHGKAYDGNGTVGQSFAPLPTDLMSPHVQSESEGQLFQHISYGIGGSGRQPALATTIQVMDRWRIVAFVRSLGVRPPS